MTFDGYMEIELAMGELAQQCRLSKEEQYQRVIQALLRMLPKPEAAITPHDFGEPNFLTCRLDLAGNIILAAPKGSAYGIPVQDGENN